MFNCFAANTYVSLEYAIPNLFNLILSQFLSAAGGIKVDHPHMSNAVVVVVAVVILVGLFCMQHYGTDKVGWLFAPIVLLWFLMIGGIGLLNIWKYDSSVLKAFSPVYIYRYFKRGGRDGWTSLGGTEALFADLAHFPVSAVQIAFTVVVFPCLLLAYSGQAAYLMRHQDHVVDAFYRSIPESIYWPVFIVATAAAIVASQATISATFSIIKQALALGCFPRVKVVHTSKKFLGQIYIPDINWILMILCIAVTAGFKNQSQIGNAYGTAVVIVMLVTTLLMILIMILVWRCHWILVLIFTGLSLVVECTYFSAVLFKIDQGGWVPLQGLNGLDSRPWPQFRTGSGALELDWCTQNWPVECLTSSPTSSQICPLSILLSFSFVSSTSPVYTVPEEERFLVKRIGPKNFHMFRCVARYGYKDLHKKDEDFEKKLFDNLFLFVRLEAMMEGCSDSDEYSLYGQQTEQSRDGLLNNNNGNTSSSVTGLTISSVDSIVPAMKSPLHVNNTVRSSGQMSSQTETDELDYLNSCRDAGVVHILGNTVVRARRESRFYKKIAVDYIYAFLRKICRENSVIFNLPHESLLNVGQVFYV
ncbi:hypothetical protein Patl1_12262 [Pistacia atlantica]|uniref:Uncharacterized protein n=1 Tax=Pistacia atlantica TaxID=434234 RepID=A0ACC1A5Q1_9ROSI|nr:hypothetical protein Patl1_12262 [Pistacia atlantica]